MLQSCWAGQLNYTHFSWAGLVLQAVNQQKWGNDHQNDFMMNLHESYVVELGFKLAIPGSAVRHATDCTMKPSCHRLIFRYGAFTVISDMVQDIVTTRSNELLARLGIEDLDLILKERRLRWYGHVKRSSGAVKTAFDLQADGKHWPGTQRWHGSSWRRGIAKSGSSRLSTVMTDIPGDLVWDLPYVQQANYLTDVDVTPVPAR